LITPSVAPFPCVLRTFSRSTFESFETILTFGSRLCDMAPKFQTVKFKMG
jgi:hypothetical protein